MVSAGPRLRGTGLGEQNFGLIYNDRHFMTDRLAIDRGLTQVHDAEGSCVPALHASVSGDGRVSNGWGSP